MPPFVPRKRRSPSPEAPPAKRQATNKKITPKSAAPRSKPSLFDAVDAPSSSKSTPADTQAFLASLGASDDSSLSDVGSDDFEDVPLAKKHKGGVGVEQDDGDDDGMDWEDAIGAGPAEQTIGAADGAIEDLSISLNDDGSVAASKSIEASGSKKGPSKRQRQIRLRTHCLHVQSLMWHNAVRNAWLIDKELHKILVTGLSDGVKREIARWKDDMGIPRSSDEEVKTPKDRRKEKKAAKAKGKSREKRAGRDWGGEADRLEKGVANLSRGDPLLRLLKVLTAYWRKRFTITAPSLRKQGYMPLKRLTEEVKAWKKDRSDAEAHGERVESKQDFFELAKKCEGSRDVGSQLFTALLRAVGLEARMVANLQPSGIGWNKHEEARPKKASAASAKSKATKSASNSDSGDESEKQIQQSKTKASVKAAKKEPPSRISGGGSKTSVIDLDADDSDLSSAPSELDDNDDDASLVDITESMPKKKKHKKYDRDLAYPIYWTEVLSPVSNTFIPVDPIVLSTVASNQDLLSTFEPRGKRADEAKQVMCYTIAHSSDGSAKDVTVRYLKRHQLPGRTKGYRMPVEKVAVYNKRGKVKKHEEYDWFKTVMSSYERPHLKRTAADALEDSTDLKPFKAATEKPKIEMESLQWYKQSAEYVLPRHLRREEAIVPEAKIVKTFTAGKGDNATEESVYSRSDVVVTKTVESWHKEGREVKFGEQPLKMVPVRAVTLIRKREMEEAERETGEKLKQGLYAIFQTDWIIPPPIKDGVIPRNAFGNMDVYVPTMVPEGAVHVPLKGTARICRKLDIDYAEACTGFEFGKQRAVPVITGVVVALANEDALIDAWEIEEEEKRRKEDVKREALCLGTWRKFLMGLRIVERMRTEYGGAGNNGVEINPFVKRAKQQQDEDAQVVDLTTPKHEEDDDAMGGGGFFLPGEEEDEPVDSKPHTHRDNGTDIDTSGGFILDETNNEDPATAARSIGDAPVTPMSLQSAHKKRKTCNKLVDEDHAKDEDMEDTATHGKSQGRAKPVAGITRRKSANVSVKAKAKTKPQPSSKAPKQLAKQATKRIALSSSDLDGDEDGSGSQVSQLSDLTTGCAEVSDAETGAHVSPRVVIPSRKRGGKATPVKSHYFDNAGGEHAEGDNQESEESEQEVVKPRKTTARTRTLRG